jgi:hypothetical protein
MATPKNPCAKTRGVNDPYEVYVAPGWEWRVLKKYQSPEGERANPYARWFCAVKGSGTFDGYDMGDTYVRDITQYGSRVPDAELAAHLAVNPWKVYR